MIISKEPNNKKKGEALTKLNILLQQDGDRDIFIQRMAEEAIAIKMYVERYVKQNVGKMLLPDVKSTTAFTNQVNLYKKGSYGNTYVILLENVCGVNLLIYFYLQVPDCLSCKFASKGRRRR